MGKFPGKYDTMPTCPAAAVGNNSGTVGRHAALVSRLETEAEMCRELLQVCHCIN